jgi:hypothetical protein
MRLFMLPAGQGRTTNVSSKEDKREKFIRLVEPRVDRALHAIHIISLLGGKNSFNYDYGDSDVDNIVQALTEATAKLAERMKHPPRQVPMPFALPRVREPKQGEQAIG